ncbi:MAG: hypothetical protein H6838_06305 [Planctomycetes bacterium]|nr:hypothetical protein [Planctomycetota bacterium]MCB9885085.1 hypothetical protein [Planctomycetota bacterium]
MRTANVVRWLVAVPLLAGCLAAQPVFGGRGVPPAPKPVPERAELDKARQGAFDALVAQLLQMSGGNVWAAQSHLQQAAWRSEETAVRYLLLEEAVRVAERAGAADIAISGVWQLASEFEIDIDEYSLAMLRRMSLAPGENAAGTAAVSAWNAAFWRVGGVDSDALLRYHDVAIRAALACGRADLHTYLNERLAWLRTWQTWHARLVARFDGLQQERQLQALGALVHGNGDVLRVQVGMLAPFLKSPPAEFADASFRAGTLGELGAERLFALREHAADAVIAEALLRAAKAALTRGWADLDATAKAQRAGLAAAWTEQLATARGVHNLRFRHEHDREQLLYAHGEWRVEHGLLLGQAVGENNFATLRYAFSNTRTVVIRGGIRSEAGLNFRCKVGNINLLLNWEVAPENHLWRDGQRHAKGPRALVAGKESTIVLVQDEGDVHVLIDGVEWWTVPGLLGGTVSVYPALGSEIFVREILVDGDVDGLVDGPRGEMM